MPTHEVVDLDHWIAEFPLQRLQEAYLRGDEQSCRIEGEMITSPYHIAIVEQLRHEPGVDWKALGIVPTDVFVFALGEPARRDITKIGGVPYRPRSKPWPVDPHGEQYTFLAQFNFSDSMDIVPSLPGDVLLLFVRDDEFTEPDWLYWEWYPVGLRDLVTLGETPAPRWSFPTCYGHIHRTWDLMVGREDSLEIPVAQTLWNVVRIEGTKIAGVIPFEEPRGGRGLFLCSVGSISPAFNVPYPWLNHPAPVPLQLVPKARELTWGDSGTIFIFFDSDDLALCWTEHSY